MEWSTVEVRDDNGEGFTVKKCEELILPAWTPNIDEKLSLIKNLEYKDGDILVCSYPKTGTHWVSNIVQFLCADGPIEDITSFTPKLMELTPPDRWSSVCEGRMRSSHLRPNRLPVSYYQNGSKIIVVVRNPKDAMVSMFYHLKNAPQFDFKMTWDLFFTVYTRGEVPFGSYFDYYDSFQAKMEQCKTADFLVVHFENLKQNGFEEIKRIQEFIGTNNSDERLQQILDKNTIKKLKADIDSGKVISPLVDKFGKSTLYRKGVIGDWKNIFTVAQNDLFDRIIEEKFKNSLFNVYY
ncbi:sulfotransferase 1 [Mactra antiquata]